MHVRDGSFLAEWPQAQGQAVAVGWLGNSQDHHEGTAPPGFAAALLPLVLEPVNVTRGWHACKLCAADDDTDLGPLVMQTSAGEIVMGNAEIHVRGPGNQVFVAPTMIYHYIEEHHYLPPQDFVEAVLAADRDGAASGS